jgi:hypothetical protein
MPGRFAARALVSGAIAGLASALAAAACSRAERRPPRRPMNAVSHIYDGGAPPPHDGRNGRNTVLGFGIHMAASVWWALFFEALLRRRAERSRRAALAAGSTLAAAAYLVDYHVVAERFRPGFERYLSNRSLLAVYAALAVGFAAAARVPAPLRRLHHHEKEDDDERDEGRPSERGPERVVAPEALR